MSAVHVDGRLGRIAIAVLVAALDWAGGALSAPAIAAERGTVETATDRPGFDYKRVIGTATADECRHLCLSSVPCVAYTWVRAGVQGPQPACWLKDEVPPARASSCCISGVK